MKFRAALAMMCLWLGGIVTYPTNLSLAAPPILHEQGLTLREVDDFLLPVDEESPAPPMAMPDPWGPPLPPIAAATSKEIAQLIVQLNDNDSYARDMACRKLIAIGATARAAVLAATRSPFPEVRSRAAEVLRRLPWTTGKDAPEVRQLMQNYGRLDEAARCNTVQQLAALPPEKVSELLLRLLMEDPSELVRWHIERALRQHSMPAPWNQAIRKIDPTDSAQALAACGWAWLGADEGKSADFFHQCLALEERRRTTDDGEVAEIFRVLIGQALAGGQHDAALALYRRQFARDPEATVARDLLAVHADSGPHRGLAQDLLCAQDPLESETLYTLGRICGRLGCLPAERALDRAAFALGGEEQQDHFGVTDFLVDHGWNGAAERELLATLQLGGDDSKPVIDSNVHFRLARIAAGRDDDRAIADHLEEALKLKDQAGASLVGHGEADINEQICWHRIRDAQKRNSPHEVEEWLDKLVKGEGADADLAMEVVSLLRDRGQDDDAKKVFERAYAVHKTALAANPGDGMAMNNLAWLCARCNQRLDEALKLSTKAMELLPNNAALLDTAAEVHFRLGHRDEAVRLETQALRLRPGDKFMAGQLKRFQGEE